MQAGSVCLCAIFQERNAVVRAESGDFLDFRDSQTIKVSDDDDFGACLNGTFDLGKRYDLGIEVDIHEGGYGTNGQDRSGGIHAGVGDSSDHVTFFFNTQSLEGQFNCIGAIGDGYAVVSAQVLGKGRFKNV